MSKVLLVEDNEMNRDMLSRRLTKKGFNVVMAVNGQIGVDMSITESPEIILMDMSLPVMDGWTAASHIKANDVTKDIPIIALTAHAMSEDREKAIAAGCDEYDTKPIDLKRLLGIMDRLLNK
ncbi:response regulator [Thalassotalea sp. ND16A]|uniref:response regulator n=1 Tax=Thalassotalea sp. ND16A TaxID=1535422 RepID=UPI00051A0C69|nr:response regulator [Thalassotalea sp. ND16A]KGJ98461.1 response regulator receiver protein [Thalassotalea sp. ND16A]